MSFYGKVTDISKLNTEGRKNNHAGMGEAQWFYFRQIAVLILLFFKQRD